MSIGDDLGEITGWEVLEPVPRVRVMIGSDSPLLFRRESDSNGELLILRLKYQKLQKFCSQCFRLTHEVSSCPERARERQTRREHRHDHQRRRDSEDERRQPRRSREPERRREPQNQAASRDNPEVARGETKNTARRRPVRRDLLDELKAPPEEPLGVSVVEKDTKDTKEWVREAFGARSEVGEASSGAGTERSGSEGKVWKRASWYGRTAEEATMVATVREQNRKWENLELKKERERRLASISSEGKQADVMEVAIPMEKEARVLGPAENSDGPGSMKAQGEKEKDLAQREGQKDREESLMGPWKIRKNRMGLGWETGTNWAWGRV